MPTNFTKAEMMGFKGLIKSFEDQLTYAKLAKKYEPETPEEMVYTRDRFWVRAPMIGASYDGFDQTSNFGGLTEMAVPVSVGFHKADPVQMSAKEMRSTGTMNDYFEAAKMQLASQINSSLRRRVALEGSIFVKRTQASSGFTDLALADAQMTEVGVPTDSRVAMIGVRSAIGMMDNLQGRQTMGPASLNAYEKAMINPNVAGYEAFKDDAPIRLAPAAGGATTVNGANQYWEPAATTTEPDGEQVNRDNRYSQLVVTAASIGGVKAGDAFTIAGVNSVHRINKQDTGQLQTFRVISVNTATNTLTVAPALISNGGNTNAGRRYQNVASTPANGAAITWLNTVAAEINPFFVRNSLLLVPGSYTVPEEAGWSVLRGTTEMGIAFTYVKQGSINDLSTKVRVDVDYGTALLDPAMAGGMVFNQS